MKYWILDCDVDNYESLRFNDEIDIELIKSFNGTSKLGTWKPGKVIRMYKRKYSNTPGLASNIPVFDKMALFVLSDFLQGNAEALPLTCDDGCFYAINVVNVCDCINYDRSEFTTFRDGKRIMKFTKYSFDKSKICKCGNIFKLKDEVLKRPFVSDEFRDAVIKNNLTGFKFELVWDSEKDI